MEMVVVYFKAVSQYYLEGFEKNNEKSSSDYTELNRRTVVNNEWEKFEGNDRGLI
jgi:hypothetical protein